MLFKLQVIQINIVYYKLTIVKKMWNGYLSNNGLFIASYLHRFVTDNDKKLNDPFFSFDIFDKNKVYFFQLSVWLVLCFKILP